MVAVKDIKEGEELTYDYGVRSENWMRVRSSCEDQEARKKEGGVCAGGEVIDETSQNGGESRQNKTGKIEMDKGCVTGGTNESRSRLKTDTVESQSGMGDDGGNCSQKRGKFKCNFFWCPVKGCASGPVQKITQHIQKVHKMDPATAASVARKKRRAPNEAVKFKIPNPSTRSSGLQHLRLFAKSTESTGITSPGPSTPSTSSAPPPAPPSTPTSLGLGGQFHTGGPFLDSLCSHLKTRSGGKGGEQSATQITRYVGKYLFHLNSSAVEEKQLLQTSPMPPYLDALSCLGIGSSGILHRILSHKAAVNFMHLGVSSTCDMV